MLSLTVVHNPGDYVQEIGAAYMKLKINEREIWRAGLRQNGYRDLAQASIQKVTVIYKRKKKDKLIRTLHV